MLSKSATRTALYFALGAALFYIPFNGGVHLFDWDEINFAEISREMLFLGEYSRVYVNFEPFYQKPPFFFWLQAGAMHLFGVNEFAARFPNALCGVLTLPLLYLIGRRLYSHRRGLIWAGVYGASVLPFLYFKSGIIDPWFNLFIFLGLYFFILSVWKRNGTNGIDLHRNKWFYLLVGGLLIGMGILTKGHVAYLVAGLVMFVYWVWKRFRMYVHIPEFVFFSLVAFLVMTAWFGWETLKNGPEFSVEFIKYQYRLFSTPDAGHKGFPGYHFVVLLVGVFPASLFAIRAFFKMPQEESPTQQDFRLWMKILFWVVLILFSVVQSKIVHYSSLCYFPLTFLAATVIDSWLGDKISFPRGLQFGLYAVGGLYMLAIFALPWIGQNPQMIAPLFDDPFAHANLEADVRWTGWEMLPGFLLLGLLLGSHQLRKRNRKGPSMLLLFGGMPIFLMLTLFFFIGRIEAYSQRAALEFFKEREGQPIRAMAYGYKTYAHLFYGTPTRRGQYCFSSEGLYEEFQKCSDELLYGDVDDPVIIITRINRAEELEAMDNLEKIESRNGFVFFTRKSAGD